MIETMTNVAPLESGGKKRVRGKRREINSWLEKKIFNRCKKETTELGKKQHVHELKEKLFREEGGGNKYWGKALGGKGGDELIFFGKKQRLEGITAKICLCYHSSGFLNPSKRGRTKQKSL